MDRTADALARLVQRPVRQPIMVSVGEPGAEYASTRSTYPSIPSIAAVNACASKKKTSGTSGYRVGGSQELRRLLGEERLLGGPL